MDSKQEEAKQLEELKKKYNEKVDENIRKNKLANSNLLRKLGMYNINSIQLPSSTFWESFKITVSSLFAYFLDNIPDLAIKLVIVSIMVCIYYMIGTTLLYITKASSLLPVETSCFPYTEKTPKIVELVTNLFSMYINENDNQNEKSIHLKFPYDKNSSNTIIDYIRNYKTSKHSEKSIIYLLSIVSSLHAYYYSIIQFTGQKLSYFSDITITLISPFIYFMTALFMYFSGSAYFMLLWFYHMKWFFKQMKTCNKTGKSSWEIMNIITNPISFYFAIIMTLIACFLSFFVGMSLFMSPVLSVPSMSILYCFFAAASFKGMINDKIVNVVDIIFKMFIYFRPAIFLSICMFTVYRSELMKYMIDYYQEYNKKSQKATNAQLQKENANKGLQKQNNQMYNINSKVSNVLEDAYLVSIPYSIIMLSILCFLLQRFQLLQPTDFSLFQNVVEINDLNIVPCGGDENGGSASDEHTFIYKGYVIFKSLLTAYQNIFKIKPTTTSNNNNNNNTMNNTMNSNSNINKNK